MVAISPRQITVELELQESQLKPVRVNITDASRRVVYSVGEPVLDVLQVDGERAAEPGRAGGRGAWRRSSLRKSAHELRG